MFPRTLKKCRHYSHRSDGGPIHSSSRPAAAAAIVDEVEPLESIPATLDSRQPLSVLIEQSSLESVHCVRRERLIVVLDELGDATRVPFV